MSLFDLGFAVSGFATDALAVTRSTPAAPVNGRVQPATTAALTVSGMVHPASGREAALVSDGNQTTDTIAIFTTVPLLVAPLPDLISYKGDTWEVRRVDDFFDTGGFYKSLAVRANNGV